MERHKGEKIKYVKMMLDDGYSSPRMEKEFGISYSLADVWRRKYIKYGKDSLENQKKPGNPLCRYQNRKNFEYFDRISNSKDFFVKIPKLKIINNSK